MAKNFARTLALLWTIVLIIIQASTPDMAKSTPKNDYVVGPGDVLDIQVWDHSDLNRKVEVSQEGVFSFPFVGKVKASDLSVFQIEQLLVKKLADGYIVSPQVSISVTEYRNQKVFLFGEVMRPGTYVLKYRSHLLELISEAGGFTDKRGSTCVIVRPEAGEEKELPTSLQDAKKSEIIQVDIDTLISGTAQTPPFYLMPGDSVYVGEAEKVFVTGEVRSPGSLKWEKGLTVRQAISMAGGGTSRASVNRVQIIRSENGKETMIKPNLADPVLPNDIIKIPESFF
jgi:polysaccharide export outer membrane protein